MAGVAGAAGAAGAAALPAEAGSTLSAPPSGAEDAVAGGTISTPSSCFGWPMRESEAERPCAQRALRSAAPAGPAMGDALSGCPLVGSVSACSVDPLSEMGAAGPVERGGSALALAGEGARAAAATAATAAVPGPGTIGGSGSAASWSLASSSSARRLSSCTLGSVRLSVVYTRAVSMASRSGSLLEPTAAIVLTDHAAPAEWPSALERAWSMNAIAIARGCLLWVCDMKNGFESPEGLCVSA